MTTNASKHGLRAAAKERSNRHAQRTPLPPRAGQVQDAKDAIGEAAGFLSLEDGGITLTQEDRIRAAQARKLAARQAEDAKESASSNGEAPEGRSRGKAEAFAAKAVAAGWKAVIEPAEDGDAVELTATRGPETLVQAWASGVWSYPTSFYGYGDRNTKPRNASGASKLLLRSEAEAQADAGKVAANKHFRKAEPKDITVQLQEAQRRLPFDPDLAPDEIIEAAMVGQAVVWYNSLSRGQESALVSRKGVRISLTKDGKRVVTFCCPVTGYRSCYVSSILRVGRGKSTVTKGSPTEGSAKVEVA